MNVQDFHNEVERIFKNALTIWDRTNNPLAWDNLPQAILNLAIKATSEALESSKETWAGAPFHLDPGEWDGKDFSPNTDAVFKVWFPYFAETDDCVNGATFNLADAIIEDASDSGGGHIVANAISQLEGTIGKLRAESAARGWILAE